MIEQLQSNVMIKQILYKNIPPGFFDYKNWGSKDSVAIRTSTNWSFGQMRDNNNVYENTFEVDNNHEIDWCVNVWYRFLWSSDYYFSLIYQFGYVCYWKQTDWGVLYSKCHIDLKHAHTRTHTHTHISKWRIFHVIEPHYNKTTRPFYSKVLRK